MKTSFKNKLFYFILGIIVSGSITAYAATTLLSKDIGFVPDNPSWQVNNVQDAINDLYTKSNEKINKIYLSETTVRSNNSHSFDISNIEGYELFTKDNFIYAFEGFGWVGNDGSTIDPVIIYDNINGIVTFPKTIGGTSGSQLDIYYYPILIY